MGENKVINDDPCPMMMIFSKLWSGTAKLLELRPAWGDFPPPIFYYISPQKSPSSEIGKGQTQSFFFLSVLSFFKCNLCP